MNEFLLAFPLITSTTITLAYSYNKNKFISQAIDKEWFYFHIEVYNIVEKKDDSNNCLSKQLSFYGLKFIVRAPVRCCC